MLQKKKVAYKGSSFSFSTTEKVDVISEIKKLNKGKAIHHDDILVERLKENVNFCLKYICIFNNNGIATSKFFLPVLPKIFEKLISKQLSTFFENIKAKSQCGFRKGYSMRHCLLLMLERRKLQLIIMNLFFNRSLNVLNCLIYDQLILSFIINISKIAK